MFFRYVYIVFLGILLALFAGFGIATFYPQPKAPPPYNTTVITPAGQIASEDAKKLFMEQDKQQKAYIKFQEQVSLYSRNVSILTLIAAVIYLVISYVLLVKEAVWSDGFLLGGLFTLIYSIIRGFNSDDGQFRFIVVTVSLVLVMLIGYLKFIKVSSAQK